MKIIKKYIGEVVLLIGIFLFFSNVVNFDNTNSLCEIMGQCGNPVAYYYDYSVRNMLGYSAVLMAIGILAIKRKDKKQ